MFHVLKTDIYSGDIDTEAYLNQSKNPAKILVSIFFHQILTIFIIVQPAYSAKILATK